jgi:hypothetical protein
MSTKSTSNTFGNITCDIPACSAMPQPIAQPRDPEKINWVIINVMKITAEQFLKYFILFK